MSKEKEFASILGLLALVPAGRATVTVGGRRFLSINSDKKTLDVEASGARKAGLHLSEFVTVQEGPVNLLEASGHVAGELSRLGWKLTLYAEGDKVLAVGSGVSRLTGRISLNPLKLKKLLEALM